MPPAGRREKHTHMRHLSAFLGRSEARGCGAGTSLVEGEAGVVVAAVPLFGAAGCVVLAGVAADG